MRRFPGPLPTVPCRLVITCSRGRRCFRRCLTGVYVIANFKETQLTDMQSGAEGRCRRSMRFRGLKLHGHIDSFQRGTGSYFALLPLENATGNFVKVVQRVPVKICWMGVIPTRGCWPPVCRRRQP